MATFDEDDERRLSKGLLWVKKKKSIAELPLQEYIYHQDVSMMMRLFLPDTVAILPNARGVLLCCVLRGTTAHREKM